MLGEVVLSHPRVRVLNALDLSKKKFNEQDVILFNLHLMDGHSIYLLRSIRSFSTIIQRSFEHFDFVSSSSAQFRIEQFLMDS